MMKKRFLAFAAILCWLAGTVISAQSNLAHWAEWRGPFLNGMARGDAPVVWNDAKNIKWKADVPGRGHSTPIVWGDKIFLTTAIPTGKPQPSPASSDQSEGRRGPGGGASANIEHRFEVICLDRKTGKIVWQKTARVATPH
jgi:hypothetical protein